MKILNILKNLTNKIKNIPQVEVVNNLTSTATDKALSANMGKTLNDKFGVDYIVDQGTSGTIRWRKWNSGVSECWGTTTSGNAGWAGWGNLYELNSFPVITFPSIFIEAPSFSTSVTLASGAATCGYEIGSITKTNVTGLCALRPNNPGGTTSATFRWHAIGKWK